MKTALILFLGGAGVFAVYRALSKYKFEIGQLVGVKADNIFNGTIDNRKKGIFLNQYLIAGSWYNESQLSSVPYT